MACNNPICTTTLLGAMDSLWFDRLILHHLPDPISVLESVSSESFTSSCQSSSSCTSIPEQDYALSDQPPVTQQVLILRFFVSKTWYTLKNHFKWKKKLDNTVITRCFLKLMNILRKRYKSDGNYNNKFVATYEMV